MSPRRLLELRGTSPERCERGTASNPDSAILNHRLLLRRTILNHCLELSLTGTEGIVFIAEVKKSDESLSGNLPLFQKVTGAKHAFQVVLNADYDGQDCFKKTTPSIVPAKTFLSQLV